MSLWAQGKEEENVPFERELTAAMALGILPDAGGLRDQEAPFGDALDAALAGLTEKAKRLRRRRPDA